MNAALRAERIACQMRNLVCLAAPEKRSLYLEKAADAQGIEISQDKDLISITLPGLLPKRKQPAVIYHDIGGNRIEELFEFQVIVIPYPFKRAVPVIDLTEADYTFPV